MGTLRMVCDDADYDAATATCAAPVWVPDAGIFPPLSASDGAAISAAILSVWVVGAAARWVRKSLD